MHLMAELRARYRPTKVRVPFVGEEPPASGTFFYAGNSQVYREGSTVSSPGSAGRLSGSVHCARLFGGSIKPPFKPAQSYTGSSSGISVCG
jgi:hypothetical protein